MNEVVFKTLKEKDFIVKNYIIRLAIDLKLSLNETILIIYFSNQEEPTLNIENITSTTSLTQEQIMEAFSKLTAINLISVNVEKLSDGSRQEIISLDNLIKHATENITTTHKEKENTNLFEIFEREFGRQLSAMEFEIINEWIESGYNKELIEEALKESIYNGVKSLKYISKILQSWKELGYKTKKDINKSFKENSNDTLLENLYNTNWLDE